MSDLLTLAEQSDGRRGTVAHIREDLDASHFSLSDGEMRQISALRKRNVRIAHPPQRAPKWDVETIE